MEESIYGIHTYVEMKVVGIIILVWLYDTYVVLEGYPLISDDKL